MTTDYSKKIKLLLQYRINIGRPQMRYGDDFWKEGTGQGT
jgi:hypothetical protein